MTSCIWSNVFSDGFDFGCVKVLLITFSRTNSAGFDDAVLCFEVCWLKSMLSSYRRTNAKTSIFTYENILQFMFNLCTKWDSPINKVTGYELDDWSYTSSRVTDTLSSTLRPDGSRATRPPMA